MDSADIKSYELLLRQRHECLTRIKSLEIGSKEYDEKFIVFQDLNHQIETLKGSIQQMLDDLSEPIYRNLIKYMAVSKRDVFALC